MDAKPKAIRDYGVIFELHGLLPVEYKRKRRSPLSRNVAFPIKLLLFSTTIM
jgi:hypothetical protein